MNPSSSIIYPTEIESLRQQLAAAQEEVTLDEQRVVDLMSQVGELSEQISKRDAEVAGLREQLEESMDNDRTAMLYLSEIKSAIGLLCRKVSKNFNNEV